MSERNLPLEIPYSRKYLEQIDVFKIWFIFGEYKTGNVDLSDTSGDIFTNIPRDKAERIIKARDDFLDFIAEEVCE